MRVNLDYVTHNVPLYDEHADSCKVLNIVNEIVRVSDDNDRPKYMSVYNAKNEINGLLEMHYVLIAKLKTEININEELGVDSVYSVDTILALRETIQEYLHDTEQYKNALRWIDKYLSTPLSSLKPVPGLDEDEPGENEPHSENLR